MSEKYARRGRTSQSNLNNVSLVRPDVVVKQDASIHDYLRAANFFFKI